MSDLLRTRPTLQSVAGCYNVLRSDAMWCSVLQCGAVCCSMLQCAAVCNMISFGQNQGEF